MIKTTLADIARALKLELHGSDTCFNGITIYADDVQPGNLFVAIQASDFDGHTEINLAEANGAAALITQHLVDSKLPQLIVPNSLIALGYIARFWRKQFSIPVIGITGSTGKSSTKEMLAAILQQTGNTLFSPGNSNDYCGVPSVLTKLHPEHNYAVIELGASQPEEIKYLAAITLPQIAIITNIAAAHLQPSKGKGFETLSGVYAEKTTIFDALPKHGVAIMNADDQFFPQWLHDIKHCQRLTFGFNPLADITIKNLQVNELQQYSFIPEHYLTPNKNPNNSGISVAGFFEPVFSFSDVICQRRLQCAIVNCNNNFSKVNL